MNAEVAEDENPRGNTYNWGYPYYMKISIYHYMIVYTAVENDQVL